MTAPDAVFAHFTPDDKSDLRLFLGKMCKDRGRQADALFKTLGDRHRTARLFRLDLFAERKPRAASWRHSSVKEDDHPPIVIGREFADRQVSGTGRRLPVDPSKVVVRLVIAKRQKVLSKPALVCRQTADFELQSVQGMLERLYLWENEKLRFTRRKLPPVAEKTEWKPRRKLEILD